MRPLFLLFFYSCFILVVLLFHTGCTNIQEQQQPPVAVGDTTANKPDTFQHAKDTSASAHDTTGLTSDTTRQAANLPDTTAPLEITYHAIALNNRRRDSLLNNTSEDRLKIILALNRVDSMHLWKVNRLILPDTFLTNLIAYSPFPDSMPELNKVHKLLLFSYPIEAFAVYENGVLIRWGPVSMGKKKTPTPVGLFHTNWKSPEKTSTENDEWLMKWYFNLDNKRGVSMHQYDLPGYPASHACMRLLEEDAEWLYNWADQWKMDHKRLIANGTAVIAYGHYAFGKPRPWLALPKNNKATGISREDLAQKIEPFLPTILKQQKKRKN